MKKPIKSNYLVHQGINTAWISALDKTKIASVKQLQSVNTGQASSDIISDVSSEAESDMQPIRRSSRIAAGVKRPDRLGQEGGNDV